MIGQKEPLEYNKQNNQEQLRIFFEIPANFQPDEQGLTYLTEQFRDQIVYQNIFLIDVGQTKRTINEQTSLEFQHMFELMVTNLEGGYCYQIHEFFRQILQIFQFDVIPLQSYIITPGRIYEPQKFISTHCILLVTIQKETFIVDIGMGWYAFQFPLKFDIYESEQMIESWIYQYRIFPNQEYFDIFQWQDAEKEWYPLIRTLYPNKDQPVSLSYLNQRLIQSGDSVFIRDNVLLISKIQKDRRVAIISYLSGQKDQPTTLNIQKQGSIEQKLINSQVELFELALYHFQVDLNKITAYIPQF